MNAVDRYIEVISQMDRRASDKTRPLSRAEQAELSAKCDELWNRMTDHQHQQVEKILARD